MDVGSAVCTLTCIFIASHLQVSECGPLFGRWQIPDPGLGAECSRAPDFGEYCDKFGSGRIKECSPCNIKQLTDESVSLPEECANVPCPYRCPEEISDSVAPAPNDSCDLTTASPTTLDVTTEASSTTTMGTTTWMITSGTTTTSVPPTEPRPTDGSLLPPWPLHEILWPIIGLFSAIFAGCCAVYCVRKHNCKRNQYVVPSPSNEPMIADEQSIEMTPPQTPTSPEFMPGHSSVTVTSTEPDLFAKLDCTCGGDAIPVGPSGAILEGLQPATRYGISVGTQDDQAFSQKYHDFIETTNTTNDDEGCTFCLQDLKSHIENNSLDFQSLKVSFGHVDDASFCRAMSRALGVVNLAYEIGTSFLEEIISIDGQRAENSLKVHVILSALITGHPSPVPYFVEEIVRKISSIHEDCLHCRHLVCAVSRDSLVTTV